MGVRPEYFMATSVDSPFYGAPRRVDEMLGAGERLQTEELPAGWLRPLSTVDSSAVGLCMAG